MAKTRIQAQPTTVPSAKKIVIVHKRALVQKYTAAGYAGIEAALNELVVDDSLRNIATKIVMVDADVPDGGVSATIPKWSGKFKRAVDAHFKSERPDYVVLLGGPDVIPHIPLRSPWGTAAKFGEESVVDSDLPYASNHRHTFDPSKFQDASRKVGRIPDVPGASDPTYLINRIREGFDAPPLDAKHHFLLSAEVWKGASSEIIRRLFGAGATLHCSPELGPNWKSAILKKPIHFINCHGDTRKNVFYGEQAGVSGPLPHAIDSYALTNKVARGAVVVAECCYGAELFEPSLPHEPQGMAFSYLEQGAATFLGSSTISYGGAAAVDLAYADELCLFFLESILNGASCGQALANARRRLVQGQTVLDNYQIKTLAQFMLLGDPARRPLGSANEKVAEKAVVAKSTRGASGGRSSDAPVPLRKISPLPVAKESVVGMDAGSLRSIPMPKGVPYSASLFSPTVGLASAWESGPRAKNYGTKSPRGSGLQGASETPSVLVVSMPNDPEAIAAMRRAWDQAKLGETVTERSVAREAPTMDFIPFSLSNRLTLEVAQYGSSNGPARKSLGYAHSSPPTKAFPPAAEGELPPDRNRRAAMVARIANGQIQSYKVIVTR